MECHGRTWPWYRGLVGGLNTPTEGGSWSLLTQPRPGWGGLEARWGIGWRG